MNQPHTAFQKKKKTASSKKWLIGVSVIIASVIAIAMVQINSNVVYFYTPDEAIAKNAELEGKIIKVGGMVVPGKVDWKPDTLDLAFVVSDLKGSDIYVTYKGAPPDMFKEGQGVVVEGNLSDKGQGLSMTARHLLVKHSEEYKKPGDHGQSMNKELLEKSILGSSSTSMP